MRGKEEKQKLLMELQLLQEKLAMLELSHSDDQPTANEFSDQSVEPPADDEIIADRHGNCHLTGMVISGIISLHNIFQS